MDQCQDGAHSVPVGFWHPTEGVPNEEHYEHRGRNQSVEGRLDRFFSNDWRDGVKLHPVSFQS